MHTGAAWKQKKAKLNIKISLKQIQSSSVRHHQPGHIELIHSKTSKVETALHLLCHYIWTFWWIFVYQASFFLNYNLPWIYSFQLCDNFFDPLARARKLLSWLTMGLPLSNILFEFGVSSGSFGCNDFCNIKRKQKWQPHFKPFPIQLI